MSSATTQQDSLYVGYDLGGTKMLAVLFDSQWKPVARRRRRTKGSEGGKAGVKRIVQTIYELLEEADVPPSRIAGIGAGCPGPVDLEDGVVIDAVNLGWQNVKLKRALEDEFHCRAEVVNDVDAGVYGENEFGAARGARTVIGVFPGTGIGGGCVYGGEIVHGGHISCMEIGHMRVRENGNLCGCGLRGCLETEASRLAISAEAAKAVYRNEAPQLAELAGTDLSNIRSGVLAKAIAGGDEVIQRIVERAARFVGVAIASMVHMLAPDVVILGGGLVEAMPKLWIEHTAAAARQHVMAPFRDTFAVKAAELGDDATVMGAAAWTRHREQQTAAP